MHAEFLVQGLRVGHMPSRLTSARIQGGSGSLLGKLAVCSAIAQDTSLYTACLFKEFAARDRPCR